MILATRSKDGYYTFCGRSGDLIISGGFNIYPREMEEFLQEQPEVAEAAVIGWPDSVRGEVPVAYVVFKDAIRLGDLEASCKDKLASFKVPRKFIAGEPTAAQRHGQSTEALTAQDLNRSPTARLRRPMRC